MNYIAQPNLVLETLIYLGQRANNYDHRVLESRLTSMGCRDLSQFQKRCKPITDLRQKLDSCIQLPQELLESLFTDLGGFPRSSVGAYSPAMLLFAPAVSQHEGDLEQLLDKLSHYGPEDVARDLLISFDLSHHFPPDNGKYTLLLKKLLPTLPLTRRSRQTFLRVQKNYSVILEQTAGCLRPAYAVFSSLSSELQQLTREYDSDMTDPGVEQYLWSSGMFQVKEGDEYHIRPLIIDPGSNLHFNLAAPEYKNIIYCGVLQSCMRELQSSPGSSQEHLLECLRLLGDNTRFDIMRYLHDRPAYGLELSHHFGLSRNTISHHLNKLFDAGLIRCNYEGARVYYSVDENHFLRLIELQKKFFVE